MRIGWIIHNKYNGVFVANACGTTTVLVDAMVYDTRQAARDDRYVEDGEMVYRVEVYDNGKVKKITKKKKK